MRSVPWNPAISNSIVTVSGRTYSRSFSSLNTHHSLINNKNLCFNRFNIYIKSSQFNTNCKYNKCHVNYIHTSAPRYTNDPYKVLGVSRNATNDEIKRKFRELAKKYHPDLNPSPDAKQKMAQITSAYELLSDPKKRKVYDQTGMQSEDAGFDPSAGGFGGFSGFGDSSFMFTDFAEMFSRMASGTGTSFTGSSRGEDIQTEITISFMEAIRGCTKNITVPARVSCNDCHGLGRQPGTSIDVCKVCNGTGKMITVMTVKPGVQRMERGPIIIGVPCRTCNGSGQVVPYPCKACGGSGDRAQTKSVSVDLPAGVRSGMQMRIPNQGHVGMRGGKNGHLFVNINIQPHPIFKWIDDDIHVNVPISLKQCLLGGSIQIPTLEGSTTVSLVPNSQPSFVKTLKNKGPPKVDSRNNGNLIIHFELKLPESLTVKQKELIEEFEKETMANSKSGGEEYAQGESSKWWKRVVGNKG
ncbi:molecular chaperone DnaJ [Theileria orientalis strain Shintoku]|uniref:Molecular chaperone DnaJ n=1 Tax=Theileria orientalis strain Shintoku TaxID=869250 RepID=J4D6X8_THEOR|nr:molecular chaperone DnaJ [Theileria orientalis strain Shintoku]PVC50248.1 molecular chaperone DnaJ [Theileria orientalis]BAM39810.1 molecular chaperone DnaJ [Theileria orientalis strain Shintoku]|eukprot:XP_009690111.1 molecular chaperone DnaJ [Theileria orientalis strain Shintoku]